MINYPLMLIFKRASEARYGKFNTMNQGNIVLEQQQRRK
jgi:hypothetical protein